MYSEDGTFIADAGTTDQRSEPAITQLANGNVVVVWRSTNGDGDSSSVKAAILTPDGTTVGTEFQVNTLTAFGQGQPTVTALPSGNFLVVWCTGNSFGSGLGDQIKAQIFSPAGAPVGTEFMVNTFDVGNQVAPVVTVLSDGRFVIAYESGGEFGNTKGETIRARLFDPSGTPLGSDFVVETSSNHPVSPVNDILFNFTSITDLSGGGFVISWTEVHQIIEAPELPPGHLELNAKARVYGADGLPIGSEFLLSAGDATFTKQSRVVSLASGGFIAVWDYHKNGSLDRIEARIFDATGHPVAPEFQIAATGLDLLRVTPLLQGGFLLTMHGTGPGNTALYYLQAYDETGAAVGPRLPIDWSPSLTDDSIVALADGRLLDASGGAHVVVHELVGPTELFGGPGNDIFIVKNPGDVIHEAPGQGADAVYTNVDYTLGAGQEIESLVALDYAGTKPLSLTGNEFANYLLGNAGANRLDGGAGADALEGRGGNDIYVIDNVGDLAIEYAGQGYDVVYTTVNYALNDTYEVESLVALDYAGTAPLSLTGNSLANYLLGNAGANRLDGGAGADALEGRGGNDTYVVDNVGDVVVEATGQGYDVIYASVNYTLTNANEVESVVALDAAGTAPLNFTGNGSANYLLGNAGANQLNGGAGADFLEGRGGNDVYVVDNAGDLVIEYAGGGNDAVYTTVSYALTEGYEVESLVALNFASTMALNLTGNSIANYLIGNDGSNILNGGAGNDALEGRGGTDTFAFSTALGANNVDYIGDFNAVDDTIQLDHNIFAGLGGGALNPNAFFAGTAAHDADDRIIYDQASGRLWFDADGAGGNAAILFANLGGSPVLTASDFQVI